MAIPDEVAQYAEGKRIVSYFPLGETQDGEEKKNIWLWTTTTDSREPYDFDSFRVFVWSLRRHRYETAYIERNLKGYSPVLLKEVELTSKSGASKYPAFRSAWRRKTASASAANTPCSASPSVSPATTPAKPPPHRQPCRTPSPLPVAETPPPTETKPRSSA